MLIYLYGHFWTLQFGVSIIYSYNALISISIRNSMPAIVIQHTFPAP